MQVTLAALREESMCGLHRSVLDSGLLKLLFDLIVDLFNVFWVEQGGELTNIQDVVDVLDEALLLDVFVGELEHNLLVVDTQCLVQIAQVVEPLHLTVVLMQVDSVLLALVNEGGQSGDRLASVTSETDE